MRSANFLKKKLWQNCFVVNFVKFLKAPFLKNSFGGGFKKKSTVHIKQCGRFPSIKKKFNIITKFLLFRMKYIIDGVYLIIITCNYFTTPKVEGRRCLILLNGVLLTWQIRNKIILLCMHYDVAFKLEKNESWKNSVISL